MIIKNFFSLTTGAGLIFFACVISAPVSLAQGLMNANIAGEYVVTSMPMKKTPGCPLIGGIRFFPGGSLTGVFVTDMARSKSIAFTGGYTIRNGMDISFTSDNSEVPLSHINGKITKTVITNPKSPPVAQLIITTSTTQCPAEMYKLTVFVDEE